MKKIIASALGLLLAFSLSTNAVAGFDWAGWQPSDQLQQKINKVIERINNNPNMSQAQKDRLTSILSGTLYSQAQVTAHWKIGIKEFLSGLAIKQRINKTSSMHGLQDE